MYNKADIRQITMESFILPFGGELDNTNRWIVAASKMPWDRISDYYASVLCDDNGRQAINSRIAFGSLYIKNALNLTDIETVFRI